MLSILSVEKFWIVLDVEKKMEHKLYNGILMEEKISYGIFVILKKLHHHHLKSND